MRKFLFLLSIALFGVILSGNAALADPCALTPGKAYIVPKTKTVYYITPSCTKKYFTSEKVFYAYFSSFNDVVSTTKKQLDRIRFDGKHTMQKPATYIAIRNAPQKPISKQTMRFYASANGDLSGVVNWNLQETSGAKINKFGTFYPSDYGTYHVYASAKSSNGNSLITTIEVSVVDKSVRPTPTICTDFTYSPWSDCNHHNLQTRKAIQSLPLGCRGGSPVLSQSCTYNGGGGKKPVCTTFYYSPWSDCQSNNTQTRTVTARLPDGCTGGNPLLSQSCTYNGGGGGGTTPPPTCTSFTYSTWGACQSNNTQTRTVISSSPTGCTGGSPVLSQTCSYTAPTCTSFTYSSWSACQSNNTQTRNVLTSSPSGCTGGTPVISQTCSYNGGGNTTTTLSGKQSWTWVYGDYAADLASIKANRSSFTHLSPTFYTVNYNYTSGVPYYSTCAWKNSCATNVANDFAGLTTKQFTDQAKAVGLKVVPAIYGGSGNAGVDTGLKNILDNTNGAGDNFINAMVSEMNANGYDGYNIDWETDGTTINGNYADKFVTFVNKWKAAMGPGKVLGADAIVSNMNGTWCSGNSGFLDFPKLNASSLDQIFIEDYEGNLGTNFNKTVVLSTANPIACDFNFVGELNMMSAPNLNLDKAVIGVMADPANTNKIAGAAFTQIKNYGFKAVAVWPQYPFMNNTGIVPSNTNWYALLADFLGSSTGGSTAPTCTSFTYNAWGACQADGTQTRTVLTSSPNGCVGGTPVLSQTCTYNAPTCTSFTYSTWGACQSNNTQTRTVLTSSPTGCTGGSPVLSQSCTYSAQTCTSFTYSNWGACQADGTQTRTVATSLPSGCTGGSPVLSQTCTYTPGTGTDIQAGPITTQTWTADKSPYRIYGDVYIPTGNRLTVKPGVTVIFQGHYRFDGPGVIDARGTSPTQRDILFTAADHNVGWYGIRIANTKGNYDAPDVSDYHLENMIIEYVVKDRSRARSFGDWAYNDSRGALYVFGGSSWSTACPRNTCGLKQSDLHLDGLMLRHNKSLSSMSPRGVGAGMYFNGLADYGPSIGLPGTVWSDMVFEDNQSATDGAAFEQHHAGPFTLKNCTFKDNIAVDKTEGGVIGYWDVSGPITLDGCTFINNDPAGFSTAGAPDVIVK